MSIGSAAANIPPGSAVSVHASPTGVLDDVASGQRGLLSDVISRKKSHESNMKTSDGDWDGEGRPPYIHVWCFRPARAGRPLC